MTNLESNILDVEDKSESAVTKQEAAGEVTPLMKKRGRNKKIVDEGGAQSSDKVIISGSNSPVSETPDVAPAPGGCSNSPGWTDR